MPNSERPLALIGSDLGFLALAIWRLSRPGRSEGRAKSRVGLKLRERIGFKEEAVAVARKLTVIMHTMLKTGELFNPNAGAIA